MHWNSPDPRVHNGGVLSVLLIGGLVGLLSCTGSHSSAGPPSVLLISVDTLRPDHLGVYGYQRPTSPNIDALAARGTVFTNAVSTAPWTLPSHASAMTGRYPAFHGLRDEGTKLAPGVPTLAEAFRGLGYRTFAVVSHVYVSREFGFERGFDHFDDALLSGGIANPIAAASVDRLLELLDEGSVAPSAATPGARPDDAAPRSDEPFFAFLHLFDPHSGYTPPPPYDSRFTDPDYAGPIDGTLASFARFRHGGAALPPAALQHLVDLYDGEIAYTDGEIGRLLRTLDERGHLDHTVVVFTSDHGEEFKEHGQIGHGKTLFAEQIRVPLIIAGHEAFPPGTQRADLASLVDLAPTLLEIAGGDDLEGSVGRSLVSAPRDDTRTVFGESVREGLEIRMARRVRHKLVHYPAGDRRFHFDLEADPGEQDPLEEDPTDGALTAALADYAARADSGWHLKFIALTGAPLRCEATLRTNGRIVNPQPLFSNLGRYPGPQFARFSHFDLEADGSALSFGLTVSRSMGSIVFETEPPDAAVSFEIDVARDAEPVGIFLSNGDELSRPTQGVTLERSDVRLAYPPRPNQNLPAGVHVRTVTAAVPVGPPAHLSDDVLEHLQTLGYVE